MTPLNALIASGACFVAAAVVALFQRRRGLLILLSVPLILVGWLILVESARAQTFSISGLSTEDILTIGAGLDKLPREQTDKNGLYQRIQAQITQQSQAAAKAKVDADKAALDKAVADALAAKDKSKDSEP